MTTFVNTCCQAVRSNKTDNVRVKPRLGRVGVTIVAV
jgi:hypothetical protein